MIKRQKLLREKKEEIVEGHYQPWMKEEENGR